MKTVIMAGGKGTRIASIAHDVPKPMVQVCGTPILQYQIENLKRDGLTDIVIVVGHLGSVIESYFGDGSHFGVRISYFRETSALGTAGALFQMPRFDDDVLLILGDILFDFDFHRFLGFYQKGQALGLAVIHPNGHTFDSSLVLTQDVCASGIPSRYVDSSCTEDCRIVQWLNKEDERRVYYNFANCGIHVISRQLLRMAREQFVPLDPHNPSAVDLDRNLLKPFIHTGTLYAYRTCEYLKDMGTPERFHETEQDILAGRLETRRIGKRKRSVFIDIHCVVHADGSPIPEIGGALCALNMAGYIAVALCDSAWQGSDGRQKQLETLLGEQGAFFDAYCRPDTLGQVLVDFCCDVSASYLIQRPSLSPDPLLVGCMRVSLLDGYTVRDLVNKLIAG